jgi:hypothetical protein
LRVLQDIIADSSQVEDAASFLSIFKSYDSVLKSNHIDPAKDRIYFKFLLKLARIEGDTWLDKFDRLLNVLAALELWS